MQQKIVALVLCLSLLASTQAFILGNDGMSGLFMMNMMQGRAPMDMAGMFGGGSTGAQQPATGGAQNTAYTNAGQGPANPFGNLFNLAIMSEGGFF